MHIQLSILIQEINLLESELITLINLANIHVNDNADSLTKTIISSLKVRFQSIVYHLKEFTKELDKSNLESIEEMSNLYISSLVFKLVINILHKTCKNPNMLVIYLDTILNDNSISKDLQLLEQALGGLIINEKNRS